MSATRWRTWLPTALACAAMLILPALAWLLVPRPAGYALPPRTQVAAAASPDPEPSTPHAVRHARLVRPSDSASPAAASGPVTGVVLDPDGHPVSQAAVSCTDRSDPIITTSTDDEGRFHLPEEAAGCLAVAHHADFNSSQPAVLAAGSPNTLRLDRGGSIEGDVVDEHGAPVASFTLAVESYQGAARDEAPTGQLKSIQDPRGAFKWEKLVPGRYVLTASADGHPPARSTPIDVDLGRTTAHVRITLAHGATLSGRVFDAATHKPVAGAQIALDSFTLARAQAGRPARSDEQGAYALEGAPPTGPFSVRVTRDGYRTRTVTGLTTRGAATLQQDIELNAIVDGGPTGEDFAGVGAFLSPASNGILFARLVPAGPAEQAGIHPGDLIRRIDGADASSLALSECMQILRGPEGSRVTVQVERAGQRVDVTIQRRAITL